MTRRTSGNRMRFVRDVLLDVKGTVAPATGGRDGPLPPMLLVLTCVSGVVDAVSFLDLGHVFVANMTGNTVFLGFGVAGSSDVSVPSSVTAIGAFVAGSAFAGRMTVIWPRNRGTLLAVGMAAEAALMLAALIVALVAGMEGGASNYALIILLAVAMAIQTTVVRTLSVPDLRTTVLTLTYTGLAADSAAGAGIGARPGRRLIAVITMFIGAVIGGALSLQVSAAAALGFAEALVLLVGVAAHRCAAGDPVWTAPR